MTTAMEVCVTTILKHFAYMCKNLMYEGFSCMKFVEAQTGIICLFLIYHCHSNRNILSPILLTRSDNIILFYVKSD